MKSELQERYERTVVKLQRGDIAPKTAEKELGFLLEVRDTVISLEEQVLLESRKADLWRMLFMDMVYECGIQAKKNDVVLKPHFVPERLEELMQLDQQGMRVLVRLWEIQAEINGYGAEYIEQFKNRRLSNG
jgi:hypothetical protein